MVRIKRVYEKPAKGDGYRVLVDRLWPHGLTKDAARVDFWMKEAAPSEPLRKWFSHDPKKWPEFQKRYRAELANHPAEIAALKRLEKQNGTVTLLFGAKDEKHNHAVVLGQVLKGRKG